MLLSKRPGVQVLAVSICRLPRLLPDANELSYITQYNAGQRQLQNAVRSIFGYVTIRITRNRLAYFRVT